LITSAGPFCYNVFFGLCVGREGEGDAGECGALILSAMRAQLKYRTYEIDTNYQLGLAAIGISSDFSGATSVLGVHVLHTTLLLLLLLLHLIVCATISWRLRRAHLLLAMLTHVALIGIDGGGVVSHLLLARGHGTLRTTSGSVV
jgi:hypothetical protein